MRIDTLSNLVYAPLIEEDAKLTGWSKSTISYVLENKNRVYNLIRGIGKSRVGNLLQRSDIEDIYMNVLQYMYNCDDYDICKAYERSKSTTIVSLEGYVYSCIKACALRFIREKFEDEKYTVRETVLEDDNEISLFDTVADRKSQDNFDKFIYQLDTICKSFEYQRYAFGPDIFQIWFIRLQTIVQGKQDKYKDILTVLGISKKEIAQVEKEITGDGAMVSIAKAITLVGISEAIRILKNYTYSANKIEKVIKLF